MATIKDILNKAAAGEALTDEEKAIATGYDPQRESDAVAAAARKRAESEAETLRKEQATLAAQLKDAQSKLEAASNAGKSDVQKLTEQVNALTQQVTAGAAERAKLVRQQKLDDVIRLSGIEFVPEVDGGIMRNALVGEFAHLADEDLATPEKVAPVIATFAARNKATIVDRSGFGAGGRPGVDGGGAKSRAVEVEKMTPEQRKADLKKRGIL
jgi:hypothetical protein